MYTCPFLHDGAVLHPGRCFGFRPFLEIHEAGFSFLRYVQIQQECTTEPRKDVTHTARQTLVAFAFHASTGYLQLPPRWSALLSNNSYQQVIPDSTITGGRFSFFFFLPSWSLNLAL